MRRGGQDAAAALPGVCWARVASPTVAQAALRSSRCFRLATVSRMSFCCGPLAMRSAMGPSAPATCASMSTWQRVAAEPTGARSRWPVTLTWRPSPFETQIAGWPPLDDAAAEVDRLGQEAGLGLDLPLRLGVAKYFDLFDAGDRVADLADVVDLVVDLGDRPRDVERLLDSLHAPSSGWTRSVARLTRRQPGHAVPVDAVEERARSSRPEEETASRSATPAACG